MSYLPAEHMTGSRSRAATQSIRAYAKSIAGAALRHDFGMHVTSIGRNVQDLLDTVDSLDNPRAIYYRYPRLSALARELDQLTEQLGDAFFTAGDLLESERATEFRRADRKIKKLIRKLGAECHYLEKYLARIQDDEIRILVRDCVNNAERIESMYLGLNLLLELQGIDDKKFEPVKVRRLFLRIARTIRTDSVGLHLSEIRIGGDATIEGIPAQLNSLFQNLLHNAAKFSSLAASPKVSVTIETVSWQELNTKFGVTGALCRGEEWLEAHIRNTGPKIDKKDESNIFNLYFTKSPPEADFAGSGMGLAIAKLIVNLHSGFLFVDLNSTMTDFVILLPARQERGPRRKVIIRRALPAQRSARN